MKLPYFKSHMHVEETCQKACNCKQEQCPNIVQCHGTVGRTLELEAKSLGMNPVTSSLSQQVSQSPGGTERAGAASLNDFLAVGH